MSKFVNDILKEGDKYSRKNIFLWICVLMCVVIAIGDMFLEHKSSEYIFSGFLTSAVLALGMTVANKAPMFNKKKEE